MIDAIVRTVVRTKFRCTSRTAATRQVERELGRYLDLAAALDDETGRRPVRVPALPGVDPDMRHWSFFMILEHNAIVNRAIAATVTALARGEAPAGSALIDPKRDVMPAATAGQEQVAAFRASVTDYLDELPSLGPLRGTRTSEHPVFGTFDAHRWHCMFGFHLQLHRRQAARVVRGAAAPA